MYIIFYISFFSLFQQYRAVIIFFFLTKVTFGVDGTYGDVCTILPHTGTFVQKCAVLGSPLEGVLSPKAINICS
jgi:hypothetical protein